MTASSFRFIIRTGPNPGTVFDLTKDVTFIGRDVGNDIVIGDAEISRQHARISKTPGGYVIEDLGSTNGTYIAGQRLSTPHVLSPGDLIAFGESVSLTFDAVDPGAAATIARPAEPMAAAPPAPSPQPERKPVVPAPPAVQPEPKKRRGWMVAGIGCLLIIIICVVVGVIMDLYYPNILYAPLRMLGFY